MSKKEKRKLEHSDDKGPSKRLKSLSEQLAGLTNPTPKEIDTEDPQWDYKLNFEGDFMPQQHVESSSLKRVPSVKRMVSATPDDLGAAYKGKRAKRTVDPFVQLEDRARFNKNDEESSMEEDDDEDEDDDDEIDEADEDGYGALKPSLMPTSAKQSEADRLEEMFRDQNEENGEPTITNDQGDELSKAKHTLNQRYLWDSFVDVRVGLQPLMEMAQRIPPPIERRQFVHIEETKEGVSGKEIQKSFKEVTQITKELLVELCKLQEALHLQTPQIRNKKEALEQEEEEEEEEEDHDEDMEGEGDNRDSALFSKYTNWKTLETEFERLKSGSGPVIDKWHAKTLYSSGLNMSKFKQINQSIVGQVDAMLDPSSHSRATKVERSQIRTLSQNDRAFGTTLETTTPTTPTTTPTTPSTPTTTTPENPEKQEMREIFDPELFTDWEFFEFLLKEQMESGGGGLALDQQKSEVWLRQQFLNLRRMQRRKRQGSKKVDRKASKGRKIRYQVHEKLVSFMAPLVHLYPNQDTPMANHLFDCLLGKPFKN